MQDRGVEGRGEEEKRSKGRGRVFYVWLVSSSYEGEGDKTVYLGARPETTKLTGSSKSQVPILPTIHKTISRRKGLARPGWSGADSASNLQANVKTYSGTFGRFQFVSSCRSVQVVRSHEAFPGHFLHRMPRGFPTFHSRNGYPGATRSADCSHQMHCLCTTQNQGQPFPSR